MVLKLSTAQEMLAIAAERNMRRALIITALPLELAAVRARLQHLGSVMTENADAVFEFEQFTATGQEWMIVTGESGAEVLPAGIFVTTAIQQFGPFEVIFFVGVAATRKPDDAPIGTVMVSKHVYLAEVGKYQDGTFKARARMLHPNSTLVALAQKLARDESWQNRISPPYAMTNPGDATYPEPFPPAALVCPIVSVNSVSADPDSVLEQHISQTYQDATGLEMEGYGALFAAERERTPCIVIRGVSDARQGKEQKLDKVHQPVAAGHAVAFGLELLDAWGQTMPAPVGRVEMVVAPTKPPRAEDPQSEQDDSGKRIEIVAHMPGSAVDYPHDRQAQLLSAVKEITGDQTAQIVGTEEGSFHLFMSVSASKWERTDANSITGLLEKKVNFPIFGTTLVSQFRDAESSRELLLTASQPLLNWPQTLPDGTSIPRPELQTLMSVVDSTEGTTTVLLGKPGSGKTSLLAKFAETLKGRDIPFLAIKADLISPSVVTEEDLQYDLGLKESPSLMLRRLSEVRPVILIIDQLDALAGYIDLSTGRLSAILNLVRRVGGDPNIKIVLSARSFEFEHDVRLKTVRANSLELELPAWSDVEKILQANGFIAAGWPADAQELLRTPQALDTFLKLSPKSALQYFTNYQSMLEVFWRDLLLSRPNGARIAKLASSIAEDMAERETLWVSRARYDEHAHDLEVLIANAILTTPPETTGSIGFSHQTVFEYALARLFAQKPGELSSYVLAREASIFVRPKLWSALTYLRVVEPSTYEAELGTLWNSPDLRSHLRLLLIEFLGQQQNPTPAETVIFDQALAASKQRRLALQAMIDSAGWFDLMKGSHIRAAMIDPEQANLVTGILARASARNSASVIDLVEAYWLADPQFDGFAWYVLQDAAEWTDRHLNAARTILDRTRIAPFAFDTVVMTIGAQQPEFAIKLAEIRLQNNLRAAKAEAERREALPTPPDEESAILASYHSPAQALTKMAEEQDAWEGLEALAIKAPLSFLNTLWPWFEELFSLLREFESGENDKGYPVDQPDLRFEGEGNLDLPEYPILGAFRVALETLALTDASGFLEWLRDHENEEAEIAQRLFANAMAKVPERFAPHALTYLLGDTRRLHLGNIEDRSDTTKRLVRSVAEFWSDAELRHFVDGVVGYNPTPASWRDAKSRQYFLKDIARLQLELLEQLPEQRVPEDAKRRIVEERRRLGEQKRGATFYGPRWIGSPMSSEEFGLAADDDVVNAFRELPDDTGWDNPKRWMEGGNIQLSRAFSEFAKTNHERAIGIIARLSPEIGNRAAGYALDAMAENADPTLIINAIVDLDGKGFGGEEFRTSSARAVERLIRRDVLIGDDMLALLTSWLSDTPMPAAPQSDSDNDEDDDLFADAAATIDDAEKKEKTDSILWGMYGGMLLPHGNYPILEVIIRILLARKEQQQLLDILSEHLNRPEDQKVWSALIRFFPYMAPADASNLAAFLTKVFDKYPALAHSRETAMALASLHWKMPDFVAKILVGWKDSPHPRMRQAYGEIATLVWLMQPQLAWPKEIVEEIITGSDIHSRTGAAFAAVNVWSETGNGVEASELLIRIMSHHEPATWTATLDLFRLVDEITPAPEWSNLLSAMTEEIPRQADFQSTFVVERLQTLLPHEAELVARFALTLTAKWCDELSDIRTGTSLAAAELVDLAVTLHRLSPSTREQGTKLFEELLYLNAYTARETLNQIDNRFSERAAISRPRLPRRKRRPSRAARRAAA